MFRREKDWESRKLNSSRLCGQVRVLVAGDSGSGKTSLVHLIVNGSTIARPHPTVGCNVSVKHITYGNLGSSSSINKGDSERDFFVELWDVSGNERYRECRSLFYSQINGVMFVYDLSQKKTKPSLNKWAVEISTTGTFSAPLGSGGPGGLPVPFIVIGNKADIAAKEGKRGSSGNLVDVARQWVEKQGLLPSSEQLPLTESFPGSGLAAAAKEARVDKEAIIKFFKMLIRRRYFSDELPLPNKWPMEPIQTPIIQSSDNLLDDNEDQLHKIPNDCFKYSAFPPLPAQRNLTPPPTLYPQQPMASTISDGYSSDLPRLISISSFSENGSTKSRRADINV